MRMYHAHHPEHVRAMDTDRLREEFLIEGLFKPGELVACYSYLDRLVVVGVTPTRATALEVDQHLIGTDYLLERRELGIVNLGQSGTVDVDGTAYAIDKGDFLYVSRGSRKISLDSADPSAPARFLCLSGPAHADFPTTHAKPADANQIQLGSGDTCNERRLFQFIHPNGIKSANLVMGYTRVSTGSVWNTMPCHTHTRRMEFYCYFDIAPEHRVFHLMGEPTQTRHLVMADGDGVLSPSWSIHSGVGTAEYSFVWAMLGDNQRFDDMDGLAIGELR